MAIFTPVLLPYQREPLLVGTPPIPDWLITELVAQGTRQKIIELSKTGPEAQQGQETIMRTIKTTDQSICV